MDRAFAQPFKVVHAGTSTRGHRYGLFSRKLDQPMSICAAGLNRAANKRDVRRILELLTAATRPNLLPGVRSVRSCFFVVSPSFKDPHSSRRNFGNSLLRAVPV